MYEPNLYKDYNKLPLLIEMVDAALDNLDWRRLHSNLALLDKDLPTSPLTWYAAWCKDGQVLFESNTETACKIGDDNGSLEDAINFHIELTNSNLEQFREIKSYSCSLTGVTYVGLHFLSPNAIVPEHSDNDSFSILYMYNASTGVVLSVDNTSYTFSKSQLFAFDASINHSARNDSSEDWIMFVIRCNRDSFNL